MLYADLAALYRVATKSLNLAVRRNHDRFPEDFMFQLTKEEGVICPMRLQSKAWRFFRLFLKATARPR